ncbi:MAG: hypothetical protein Q9212_000660 [Teloschistes hypoglaucus]
MSSSGPSFEPTKDTDLFKVDIPKVGIEIESILFSLVGADENDAAVKDPDYKTKGKVLKFFVPTPARNRPAENQLSQPDPTLNSERSHWVPTAEVQSSLKSIQTEMIYGGATRRPAVDAKKELGAVGTEIANFLRALDDRTTQAQDFCKELDVAIEKARQDDDAKALKKAEDDKATRASTVIGRPFMRPVNFIDEQTQGFITNLAKVNANIGWVADRKSGGSGLGIHATAAIPLAAIYQMIKTAIDFKEPLFGNQSFRDNEAMALISLDQIKPTTHFDMGKVQWDRANSSYGEYTVVGLLIMICSYVNASASTVSDTDMNLKKKTPLMPRMDFKAMLDITLSYMDEASAKAFRQNLVEIVARLAKHVDLANRFFNWERQNPPKAGLDSEAPPVQPPSEPVEDPKQPPPPPAPPKAGSKPSGKPADKPSDQPKIERWNLNVKTWLTRLAEGGPDLIAIFEKDFRGAQIGGLENKVEHLIDSPEVYCPILEFRGVGTCPPNALTQQSNFFEKLLERVKHWHEVARDLGRSEIK